MELPKIQFVERASTLRQREPKVHEPKELAAILGRIWPEEMVPELMKRLGFEEADWREIATSAAPPRNDRD